jgi:hypothetical protein
MMKKVNNKKIMQESITATYKPNITPIHNGYRLYDCNSKDLYTRTPKYSKCSVIKTQHLNISSNTTNNRS